MNAVSTNYRELTSPEEIHRVAAECALAWLNPDIPMRQYETAVKAELQGYRDGIPCAPFDALIRCMHQLPAQFARSRPRLLDVGASAGYYRDVLRIGSYDVDYTGLDFSPHFKTLAEKLYPGIRLDIGDARKLPYSNESFDIVLSGACMMHNLQYEQILNQTVRVSRKYVILHRTPILIEKPTTFYVKEAYGIPCLEAHFNEQELLVLFAKYNLELLYSVDVFWDASKGFGHRTYLLEKGSELAHHPV